MVASSSKLCGVMVAIDQCFVLCLPGDSLNKPQELGRGLSVDHEPCKREDLTWSLQDLHGKPDAVLHVCNPSVPGGRWEVETGEFLEVCGKMCGPSLPVADEDCVSDKANNN